MEDELAIQKIITERLKGAIQAQLKVRYPSRAYDGSFKPKSGGASPLSDRIYTGKLYNSVDVQFINDEDQVKLQLSFPDAPEWYWVNFGRRGKKQDASLKYPPLSSIDRWVVAKPGINLAVRDKQGRFIERKSLVYLIQRSIGEHGYYGIKFIDRAIENTAQQLQEEFGEWARIYLSKFLGDNLGEIN
jgi:hypothetical protein